MILIKPTKAETKQAVTDNAAREMIDAEAAEREKKTARLREKRLAAEAETVEEPKKLPAKRSKRG